MAAGSASAFVITASRSRHRGLDQQGREGRDYSLAFDGAHSAQPRRIERHRQLAGRRHRRQRLRPGHDASPRRESSRKESFARSEEHTSELQSLMRISYAVFCLKKKKYNAIITRRHHTSKAEKS